MAGAKPARQIEESGTNFAALFPQDTLNAAIQAAIDKDRVVVFGGSSCPYCIDITRTFAASGVKYTFYNFDKLTAGDITGPQLHKALKSLTGQRTMPYVYINSHLMGGCDDTKALIASGEFDKLVSANRLTHDSANDLESVGGSRTQPTSPASKTTYFTFPETVDNRVIRLVAAQVFVIGVLIAVLAYKRDEAWIWVSRGLSIFLLVDFCLRFYGGGCISPLGRIAKLAASSWGTPVWGSGAPKQFAVAVGIFFSTVILIFEFTDVWPVVTAFAGTLAFFAFLQAFFNFCAGCLMFKLGIKSGIIRGVDT